MACLNLGILGGWQAWRPDARWGMCGCAARVQCAVCSVGTVGGTSTHPAPAPRGLCIGRDRGKLGQAGAHSLKT
eukprot:scaffold5502_cov115-Isochrysis_galbana.AAC.10